MNSICVILQGYSNNPKQLGNSIRNLNKIGIKDVIVSTYKPCVNYKYLRKLHYKIFFNDEGDDLINANTKNLRPHVKINISNDIYPRTKNEVDTKLIKSSPSWKFVSSKIKAINFKLTTIKNGIKLIDTNPKYILVCRADLEIINLGDCILNWIKQLTPTNDFFDSKFFVPFIHDSVYFSNDMWIFGNATDIYKYFDIPFFKQLSDYNYTHDGLIVERYFNSTAYCIYKNITEPEFDYKEFTEKFLVIDTTAKSFWYKTNSLLPC